MAASVKPRVKRPWKLECCRCWKLGIPPTWLVVAAAILVQIGFGFYPVIVRRYATAHKANPVIFSFYRDAFCTPLLFTCAIIAERKLVIPRPKMLFLFILLGVLGMFGNQLLFILGVYWAGADIASAFQPLIPVWTAIFAYLACIEKLPSASLLHTWTKFGAILLAAGGAIEATLTSSSLFSGEHKAVTQYLMGCAALFGNTICMAVYILLQKRFIFNRLSCKWRDYPVSVTAYSYFFGAIFMGLASLYVFPVKKSHEFIIPSQTIVALVYAVFITSALCYLLITWTNMYLPSTIVAAFWPVQVLVTLVSSFLINQEKLAPLQYIGAVMIAVGLLLLLFSNHMEGRQADGLTVVYCCPRGPSHTCVDVYFAPGPNQRMQGTDKQPLLKSHNDSASHTDGDLKPPKYSMVN